MIIRGQQIQYWLGFGWLTGPIFGKELRVSSRRRRNYIIRSLYVAVLVLMLSTVWLFMQRLQNATAYQSTQLIELGRVLTMLVTWIQFIVCQIVAVVMLSTAISDEIYNKTLGVLMTTPISSFQIVMGKLLSKLLQLLLLMGISLPVLATVRVFGGIPWAYILFSLGVTLCVCVLAGTLSLYFSISQRKAYIVIIQTLMTLFLVFALIPLLAGWFIEEILDYPVEKLLSYFLVTNPYAMMGTGTGWLMSPRAVTAGLIAKWPWHITVMLGVSVVLLLLTSMRVRKVALRQIAGSTRIIGSRKKKVKPKQTRSLSVIRSMGTWPVLWKDLRTPVLRRSRGRKIITALMMIVILAFIYFMMYMENTWDDDDMHVFLCVSFSILATIFTIVIPATCITSEKEARSWPILLGTTQDDLRIVASKGLAMARWCLPSWCLLLGHVLVFTVMGIIHPTAIFHLMLVMVSMMTLLIGTGLYWSARLRRTTTAVVCNFILPLVIWLLIPLLWGMLIGIAGVSENGIESYVCWHPFVQVGIISQACSGHNGSVEAYQWAWGRWDAGKSTAFLLITTCVYSLMGLAFAWRGKCLFRRKIF